MCFFSHLGYMFKMWNNVKKARSFPRYDFVGCCPVAIIFFETFSCSFIPKSETL